VPALEVSLSWLPLRRRTWKQAQDPSGGQKRCGSQDRRMDPVGRKVARLVRNFELACIICNSMHASTAGKGGAGS